MNDSLVERLLNEFSSPKELSKRQISLFLKPEVIEKLDQITKELNNYTEKNTSRNYLIELAVESLIDSFPKAISEYNKKYNSKDTDFDTVIYPSDYTGIDTLINERKWYYVRINREYISRVKYIALYLGNPTSRITHYAKVKNYVPEVINGKTKYTIYIDGDVIPLETPVKLGDTNPLGVRSPKYTTLEKLKKAKEFSDLN